MVGGEATTTEAPLPLRRNADFVLLTAGQVVSLVGSQAQALALPLLVVALTHSATAASVVLALNAAAFLVVGVVAGTFVDRHDRKAVMMLSDAGRAAATMAVPVMLWLHWPTMPVIAAEVLATASLATAFNAANAASLPNLVGDAQLPAAVARYQQARNGVRLLGATLAGFFYDLGRAVPFVVDASSFVVSVLSLGAIRARFQERAERRTSSVGEDLREGFAWLWHQRAIRALTLLDAGDNLRYAGGYLIIILLARNVHADALTIGVIFTAAGLGALVGSSIAAAVGARLSLGRIGVLMIWSEALSFPLYALCHDALEIAAIAAFESIVDPIFRVALAAYTAEVAPDELRGRVNGATQLLVGGLAPLGLLLAGVLSASVGVRATAACFGAWLVLLAVWATASPTLRRAGRQVAAEPARVTRGP